MAGIGIIGYHRPNTLMLSDPRDIECPWGLECFKLVASHSVDKAGFFALHGNVTLKSRVHPVFQLKADYGCVGGDNSESVDIPQEHVAIVSDSTEQPMEPPVWTHVSTTTRESFTLFYLSLATISDGLAHSRGSSCS